MRRFGSRALLPVYLAMVLLSGLVVSSCGQSSQEEGSQEDGSRQAAVGEESTTEAADVPSTTAAAPEREEQPAEAEEAPAVQDRETEEKAAAEQAVEVAAVPPGDPTMRLSVPKLGISGALVAGGEAGLELGAMHLDGTGYPWQPGSNTYIAGHRVGFPGTGSDRIFYDLPAMAAGDEVTLADSLGQEYNYAVSEVFAVTPFDLWVTAPTGEDTVTLQVCTETPEDWTTIGPKLMESGPESGRLIVRADRVA